MTAQRLWLGIGFYWAAAAATLVVARPAVGDGWSTTSAAALAGALVGVALFVVLAQLPPRRIAVGPLAGVVVASAAAEEIVWRGLLLGVLSFRAGAAVALVATSLAFAAVHRRGRGGHLLAGLAFGSAFLLSGGLVAPCAAHATYNLLVAGARA